MNHLTTEALNMYLDDALDPRERAAAAAHLAICSACQGELAALRQLFSALEALPPDSLPVDLAAQVLGQIARAPEPRITQMAPDREPGHEIEDNRQETRDNELQTTDYRQNTQPALAIVALIVQIALTVALAVWLIPQLMAVASANLGGLGLPGSLDLLSALVALNGQLAATRTALFELADISGALSTGPLSTFSAAQWAIILAGAGIVWFFGNRFLLAGSPERRGNHQEAA
jgi:anti-sigma factor RsiW